MFPPKKSGHTSDPQPSWENEQFLVLNHPEVPGRVVLPSSWMAFSIGASFVISPMDQRWNLGWIPVSSAKEPVGTFD